MRPSVKWNSMLLSNTDDHSQEIFLPCLEYICTGFANTFLEPIRNDQEKVCSVTAAESAVLSFPDAQLSD